MNGSLTHRPMGPVGGGGPSDQTPPDINSAVIVNSFRVQAVVERLTMHIRMGNKSEPNEFFNLCLSLARGIDFAVSNNEIPPRAQDLPILLKQVCQRKNDLPIYAAIMVLMTSVKIACKSGWFLVKDADELMALTNEIWSNFSSPADIKIEPNSSPPIISEVMSRFFPLLRMGHILASLEVKSGFGAFVIDFPIPKNSVSAQERIRLIVVQTDNVLTSSCLITPAQVNFLINGKGVERRINISMDSGPQFPTNVTSMLRYGANLLQAIGNFNGNYIIILAVMSTIESSDVPVLEDYVQPNTNSLESDSEVIEGPSRISLNCPISFRRIKTPVKGKLCKHHQCFDYENYIEMNSRRPSWRCPHCNQYVCYTDIHIDQNMVKILKEVGDNVADVMILSDGTWKPVIESDDHTDGLHDKAVRQEQAGSEQCEPMMFSNTQADIVDLTVGGENDAMDICEVVEKKPSKDVLHSYSAASNLAVPLEVNNTSELAQNATLVEDDFWAGLLFCPPASNGVPPPSTYELPGINNVLTPVLTDAISPALNRESVDVRGATPPLTSLPQGQFSTFNLQLQPSQVGNSIISSELGRPSIPRNITRNPIAVQALPAPSQLPNSNQRRSLNPLMPNGAPYLPSQTSPSMPPLTDTFNVLGGETERQQQFSRSLLNPLSGSDMSSSSLQQYQATQNWDHQDHSYIPSRSFQQVIGLPTSSQVQGTLRVSHGLPQERQTSQHQSAPNMRMPQMMNQSHANVRLSTQLPQQGSQSVPSPAAGNAANTNNRYVAAAQRSTQMARSPPAVPVQLQPRVGTSYPMTVDGIRTSIAEHRGVNMGGIVQPVSRPDGPVDLTSFPSEQNWRPTGRMRGSLSGQPYSAALSQFVIRPTQSAQASRPPAPDLQVLIANNMNSRGQQQ